METEAGSEQAESNEYKFLSAKDYENTLPIGLKPLSGEGEGGRSLDSGLRGR